MVHWNIVANLNQLLEGITLATCQYDSYTTNSTIKQTGYLSGNACKYTLYNSAEHAEMYYYMLKCTHENRINVTLSSMLNI